MEAFNIDVQGLHEWALENEFDPDHYSLNKLIELYDSEQPESKWDRKLNDGIEEGETKWQ